MLKSEITVRTVIPALAAMLIAWHGIANGQDEVRIAVGVDPVFTPWWIAEQKGYFKQQKINAQIRQYQGPSDVADATMAGEADIASVGSASWMPRIVRGSITVLATMATSPNTFKIAAHTSIKSLADLKGKKLGTIGGSSTDYLWTLVARKMNEPEKSLNLVAVPPPELIPALDRGDIQAFFAFEPWPARAIQVSGKDKVHILATSADIGYFLHFVVGANKKFVESKPDVTVRVLAALRDAIQDMKKSPADATNIAASTNKIKPDLARYVLDLYDWGLTVTDEMVSAAKREEQWLRSKERLRGDPIDWNKVVDRRFVDQAMTRK
jgi:ABC-type nitrate/sulfonate/bicarbonate transport system substrate-binding protein